jgi:hypothetical protein
MQEGAKVAYQLCTVKVCRSGVMLASRCTVGTVGCCRRGTGCSWVLGHWTTQETLASADPLWSHIRVGRIGCTGNDSGFCEGLTVCNDGCLMAFLSPCM